MAILELKLHEIDSYIGGGTTTKKGTISIMSNNASSGEVRPTIEFPIRPLHPLLPGGTILPAINPFASPSDIYLMSKKNVVTKYKFYISNISFQKKMYQPTEIIAVISVYPMGGGKKNTTQWDPIEKNYLVKTFKDHRVSLISMENMDTVEANRKVIGDDYFIHDVQPHYRKDFMNITMKIYSLDKLLTLTNTSRSFVAKKLCDDILKTELQTYTVPYNKDLHIKHTSNNLQVLKYLPEGRTEKKEHIFPYLVQYNETFYDMICRTANRWGEFLYYENNMLNVGSKNDAGTPVTSWRDLDYIEIDDHQLAEKSATYAADAVYDDHILENDLKKSPTTIKNLVTCDADTGLDRWFMKTFAKFYSNTKNLPSFLGDLAFDEAYDQLAARTNVNYLNDIFNEKYFKGSTPEEQYGYDSSPSKFNQFSELESQFKEDKYKKIVEKELAASKLGIKLNFDTTYPDVKLGDIIKLSDDKNDQETFIVVDIKCDTKQRLCINDQKEVVVRDESPVLNFEVIALGKKEGDIFYPTMLPSGHIRFSGPQVATVTDADDPLSQNRVRVMFDSWQKVKTKEGDKEIPIDAATKAASSPWLIYASASSSQGNGLFGNHYEKDKVLVSFAHGNVERPYIIGGLSTVGNKVANSTNDRSLSLNSPGGHALRLEDGAGAGLTAFLSGTFLPAYNQITTFIPSISGVDILQGTKYTEKRSKCYEGGFQLTDDLGVYSITGSTDGRNVTVKSAWGDVKINAFTGISIEAPNGNISIKGKNVKIEAGNNLELISGTNVDYTNFRHSTSKTKSTILSTAEIAVAVAKKFATKLQIIDLTFVRCVGEIIFRPVEGALTVRSNRFLKLEAGKGSCDYPYEAYKKDRDAQVQKKEAKDEKAIREGLKMKAGMIELISKINILADEVDRRYIKHYNACVALFNANNGYNQLIERYRYLAEGYTGNHNIRICKTYQELDGKMWAKPPYKELTENDLEFDNCFQVDNLDNVSPNAINELSHRRAAVAHLRSDNSKRKAVIKARKLARKEILAAANTLREAICKFLDRNQLSANTVNHELGWFLNTDIPNNFMTTMKKAFSKESLGDSFYYKELTAEQKQLANNIEADDLANHKKALKRKAAVVLMETLGFKDEWRTPVLLTADVVAAAIVPAGPIPVPPADPVPPVRAVPRRYFDEDEIISDAHWSNYVDSITSVPKLNATQYAAAKTAWDALKGLADVSTIKNWHKTRKENSSWSDAKNGGILFTHKGNTYSLKNVIDPVEVPGKENLAEIEDPNDPVNNFLNDIRESMKSLN